MFSVNVTSLNKSFGHLRVLSDLNFNIPETCNCLGILGRNGAGKTTLIKILVGLLKPTSGSITICNDIGNQATSFFSPTQAAYVPDHNLFIDTISVQHYLGVYRALNSLIGVSTDEILRESLIQEFSFQEYRHRIISKLSKGSKRKIDVIASISSNIPMVLLDEPCDGLDIPSRLTLASVINKYKSRKKFRVSSHDLGFVTSVCDLLLVIDHGRVVDIMEIKNDVECIKKRISTAYGLDTY